MLVYRVIILVVIVKKNAGWEEIGGLPVRTHFSDYSKPLMGYSGEPPDGDPKGAPFGDSPVWEAPLGTPDWLESLWESPKGTPKTPTKRLLDGF